ncbi:DinB family protein [Xylanimonas allomyrinae]|uniref:DinB family protein n=1 Tax=Xylanimonas allomyrinae TaxID=2509459 RepID=A0A4V0YED6_9MICO|nr:DinB family protein [Xylanimonas allomyrinae]QAY63841.1 DinB family protein [Xylanimonas allomyrinae]
MRDDGVTPDTKDWTWVLGRRCPECGFDAASVDPLTVGAQVRAMLPRWVAALAHPDVRVRPEPGVWSTLEYGAHVRDVFRVFDGRLASMLTSDDPLFANWDQDAAALDADYAHQDPRVVARELVEAGESVATRFDVVGPGDLGRPGRRSNGSVFTVRTLGQYFLHDVAHHLHDVGA